MSEKKMLRYEHAFQQVLDATGTFMRHIDCPFTATEVVVKQVSFYLTGNTAGVFSVRSSALTGQSNSNLGFFVDPCAVYPGITYPLVMSPSGSYKFEVLEDETITGALDGAVLALHLEFRRRG